MSVSSPVSNTTTTSRFANPPKWVKNILFFGLCAFGAGALIYNVLPSNRIEQPASFTPARASRGDFAETVEKVNAEFRAYWKRYKIEPANRAPDLAIARRLSLGLMGTVPSLEEIRVLEDTSRLKPEERIEWYLSRILEDRRYAGYVAERLARAYVGTEDGPFIIYRRRRFVTWLSDRLHQQDMQYDDIVQALISGDGLWTDSPEVNFLTVTADQAMENKPDSIRLAGRTVRAFLGTRIDCLQCHDENRTDDPSAFPDGEGDTRDGTQRDFHRLAAFFSEAENSLRGIQDAKDKKYQYKFLYEEEEETVEPAVPFNVELLEEKGNRRQRLARWVTHPKNRPFARAMVNRVWALMFGRALHDPIDNIPLDDVDDPALETLATDFIDHGFNIRRLIRVIAATEVFQLDSRSESFEITPLHERKWASFPLTRLRPEQVAGGLIQASSLRTIDANAHIFSQIARYGQENDFVKRYGDTGEDEFEDRGGTIPQRLLMMNGNLVKERTKGDITNASARIAALAPTDEKAVETAYLVVLSRRPDVRESAHFTKAFKGVKGNARQNMLEDLYWVLLNSTEFGWNH